jgi:hypothetical protein
MYDNNIDRIYKNIVQSRDVISTFERVEKLIKFANFIIFKKLWLPIYLNI